MRSQLGLAVLAGLSLSAVAFGQSEPFGFKNRELTIPEGREWPKYFIEEVKGIYGRLIFAPEGAEYRSVKIRGAAYIYSDTLVQTVDGWVWKDLNTGIDYVMLPSGRIVIAESVGEKATIDLAKVQTNFYYQSYQVNSMHFNLTSKEIAAATYLVFGEYAAVDKIFEENRGMGWGGGSAAINPNLMPLPLEDSFVALRYGDYWQGIRMRTPELSLLVAQMLDESKAEVLVGTLAGGAGVTPTGYMIEEAQRLIDGLPFRLQLNQLPWLTKQEQIDALIESLAWGWDEAIVNTLVRQGEEVIPVLIDHYEKDRRLAPSTSMTNTFGLGTMREVLLNALSRIWIGMPMPKPVLGGQPMAKAEADWLRARWAEQKDMWLVDRLSYALLESDGGLINTWGRRFYEPVGESTRIAKNLGRPAMRLDEIQPADRKKLIEMIEQKYERAVKRGAVSRTTNIPELLVFLAALDQKKSKEYLRQYCSWIIAERAATERYFPTDRSLFGLVTAQRIALGDRDQALSDFKKMAAFQENSRNFYEIDFWPAVEFPNDKRVQEFYREYLEECAEFLEEPGKPFTFFRNQFHYNSGKWLLQSPAVRDWVLSQLAIDTEIGEFEVKQERSFESVTYRLGDFTESTSASRDELDVVHEGSRKARYNEVILMLLRGTVLKWRPWVPSSREVVDQQIRRVKDDFRKGNLNFAQREQDHVRVWRP